MIAYNKLWLYNLYVLNEANEAFYNGIITLEEKARIREKHPFRFYTPNSFLVIGLFLLTVIIAIFSIGLFSLPFISGDVETIMGIIATIVGLVSYAALEFFTRKRHHYNSGVDHALMLVSASCFMIGLNSLFSPFALFNAFAAAILASYLGLRFTDAFWSSVAFCSTIVMIVLGIMTYIPVLKPFLPILLIGWCALSLLMVKAWRKTTQRIYYASSLLSLEVFAAIGFYAFGNYSVVKEIGNTLLNPSAGNAPIPFVLIFWSFTILVPFIYLLYGIMRKNILYIRISLFCIAAMTLTIRYYYALLPAETILTLAGITLIGLSWFLINYLKRPRYGFTSLKLKSSKENKNLESLIVVESFSNNSTSSESQLFQGGSGGGGGATGNY